jgi:hypothetical protein
MADTFTCFLRVDDRVILNGRCWGMISGNTKYWSMRVSDVYMRTDLPDRPFHARLFSFKRNLWVDYGPVEGIHLSGGGAPCWSNARFKMCFGAVRTGHAWRNALSTKGGRRRFFEHR